MIMIVANTGRSWRSRDSFIKTNYSFLGRSSLPKNHRSKELSNSLHRDKKQSPLTKSMIEDISKEADRLDKNIGLVKQMNKLKQMDLLNSK